MNTPVSDFVRAYAESGCVRMHMPGHKGQGGTGAEALDITEISGAGELYTSEGTIGQAEALTAELFGTQKTCWSTEGSSQCIRAMLALVTRFGESRSRTILAARNAHRAFLTACALLELQPEWLWPENGSFSLCSCQITALQVDTALRSLETPPAAVYLTSPDYLGRLQDIEGIARVCHMHGVPLVVDNAHGSYLKFLEPSLHPIDLGADLCCDSAHKTLPALTGCAYLHISRQAPESYARNAKRALSAFGSTSPSWLMLQSLDQVNAALCGEFRNDLLKTLLAVLKMKRRLREKGWEFTEEEPLKITVYARKAGYTGSELADLLRSGGIEPEYADPDYLVLMISPSNSQSDLEKLEEVLSSLPVRKERRAENFCMPRPERKLSVAHALFAPAEEIPVSDCAGRILAAPALSCPPAISIIVSGEKIPQEALPIFRYYGHETVSVVKQS